MCCCSHIRRLAFLLGLLALAPVLALPRTYTTNFPLTENQISESGNWINGGAVGGPGLWGDVQTNGTIGFGVSEPTTYGDPTAVLSGSWGLTQTVQGTIKINTTPTTCCHELELRLRTSISSGRITGYEILCSIANDGTGSTAYMAIVRWNGPNGSFTGLGDASPQRRCSNNDVIKATVTGDASHTVISVWQNGNPVTFSPCNCTAVPDNTGAGNQGWQTGSPGIGFYDNQDSNWNYFGWRTFSATDGAGPAPPTNLSSTPH